jgi:AAA+ superfamily predicted ATPase
VQPTPLPDLELLIRSSHPLIALESDEEERALALLSATVERLALASFRWTASQGLRRHLEPSPIYGTAKLDACLDHIAASGLPSAVYQLEGALPLLTDAERLAKLLSLDEPLRRVGSTVVLTGHADDLPAYASRRLARVRVEPPSDADYHQLVNAILSDVRKRMRVQMMLDAEGAQTLISHLRGLSLLEARKIVTAAIVRDGKLHRDDFPYVVQGKAALVAKSGVLEYFPAEQGLDQVAGLGRLKQWLTLRAPFFHDPSRAQAFGLSPPRGLLLLGVQGCGKSLCAKATARVFGLPLLRLDPARLYDKYLGESEKNLRRATELAERLAPIVLWIDELEKVFGGDSGEGSGVARRVLGTFLTWLQEKRSSVFVVATCNDVTTLPPELLRKGRFDELFFVDLPNAATRAEILRIALVARRRDPGQFALSAFAARTEGFSGAELEQVVVAALYSAFGENAELCDRHVHEEIEATVPLAVTMSEPIRALRAWANTRTVPSD